MPASRPLAVVYICVAVWCLGVTSVAAAPDSARSNWMTQVYRTAMPSVVDIRGDKVDELSSGRNAGGSGMGMGTGVVIDPRGYIVTNFHVVDGIRTIQVTTAMQQKATATLVMRDPETDLAIIKIVPTAPLTPITFGRSHDVEAGEEVVALGNPFGYAGTMTNGIVSGVEREVEVNDSLVYRNVIQTNAAINPGNSGGPLMNIMGEMIGVNAAIRQGAECIAFAIPVDQVMDVAAKMLSTVVADSCHVGFYVRCDTNRVVVSSLTENNASESAVCVGDIVESVNGVKVSHPLEFYRALLSKSRGETISLCVRRGETSGDRQITLSPPRGASSPQRPAIDPASVSTHVTSRYPSATQPANDPASTPRTTVNSQNSESVQRNDLWEPLGIRIEPIPWVEFQTKYQKYLVLYPNGGVRITAVRPQGLFAREGVRAGDVIVGVHEWNPASHDDWRYIADEWKNLKSLGNVLVLIIRGDDGHFYKYVPTE